MHPIFIPPIAHSVDTIIGVLACLLAESRVLFHSASRTALAQVPLLSPLIMSQNVFRIYPKKCSKCLMRHKVP